MTKPLNVLVVDDSVTIRAMMMRVLGDAKGIRATAVRSAEEAEAALRVEHFDAVTLDVEMPGMNGLDYLQTLVRRKIPVVMLSSSTGRGADARARAMAEGASACFDKADAVREAAALIRLVRDAARGRKHRDPEDQAAA